MDTTKLMAGQRVLMRSGPFGNTGTVTGITSGCIVVQVDIPGDPRGLHGLRPDMGCELHFDMTGGSLPDYAGECGGWSLEQVLHGKDAEYLSSWERRRDDPSTW